MNEDRFGVVAVTIDPANVNSNGTGEQTFAVKGLRVGDFVMVNKPSLTAGVGVAGARVSAADTLALTFVNGTAGGLDPNSETYLVFVFRGEKTPGVFNV